MGRVARIEALSNIYGFRHVRQTDNMQPELMLNPMTPVIFFYTFL
jgi:hypothetical protein